ncbi:MAG: hypothetical protein JST70_16000 [Bacteroidetes bacterium]|nr:hypothetical protein [Bacteroidota bacterium]
MRQLFLVALILIPALSRAQADADNSFHITLNTPLITSYSNIDEVLAPRVLQNAIELTLTQKGYTRNIMASINYTGISQTDIAPNWISLKLRSVNSSNVIIYQPQVNLSLSPILLSTLPASSGNENIILVYDLVINPSNIFLFTGNINYSIAFSIQ